MLVSIVRVSVEVEEIGRLGVVVGAERGRRRWVRVGALERRWRSAMVEAVMREMETARREKETARGEKEKWFGRKAR